MKTRLARHLGASAAARLYRLLVDATLLQVHATRLPATLVLSQLPPATLPWRVPQDMDVELQVAGDLGRRLTAAMERAFARGAEAVLAIGADAPGLQPHHLLWASRMLERCTAVVGPARDGGFWLLGLAVPPGELLSGLPWSSSGTRQALEERLAQRGLAWRRGPWLRDVDTLRDLCLSVVEGSMLRCWLAARASQTTLWRPSG